MKRDDRVVVVKKVEKKTTRLDRECPVRIDLIDQWRWDRGVVQFNPMPMTMGEAESLYRELGVVLKGVRYGH